MLTFFQLIQTDGIVTSVISILKHIEHIGTDERNLMLFSSKEFLFLCIN